MRHMDSIEDYFNEHPVGSLTYEDYDSDELPVLREAGNVYSCKKCGALVLDESRATHTADHEATLKLVHDLHNAAHHHLT